MGVRRKGAKSANTFNHGWHGSTRIGKLTAKNAKHAKGEGGRKIGGRKMGRDGFNRREHSAAKPQPREASGFDRKI